MMFDQNRQRLMNATQGGLIVLTGYSAMQQSGDMAAPFLQESSFWWLTGVSEPGWRVIIDAYRRHTTLVRPQRSDIDIIFNGDSDDAAVLAASGADEVISAKEFEVRLRHLHRSHAVVHTVNQSHRHEFVANPAGHELVRVLERIFDSVIDCTRTLAELRAIKQPHEIAAMKRAAKLSVQAFTEVRQLLSTCKTEYELEAEFTYRFRRANATHAYEPIVASGANACTLHYIANSDPLRARDMVLIDIGARVDGYASDITRTYCLRPTKRQRAVHTAVQRAQQRIIDMIAPGLSVVEYGQRCDEIMKDALESLDLLPDRDDEATYRKYFPHAVSHGLGVDTHDSLGGPRYFVPGMVLTVEPGIYIADEGIGVRIEDDILVTDTGHQNLTGALSTDL